MVGTKLEQLKVEISKYLGIPYLTNRPYKFSTDPVIVGKGSAKEIALKTVEIANEKNVKLLDFNEQEIYNFQKKNKVGIDCSGLAVHLLNFYFGLNLNVRQNSANKLTSSPLSSEININEAQTGDLVRQKDGKHLLFIIEKVGDTIFYVDSSRDGRGVRLGEFNITDKSFPNNGIFRLKNTTN